MMSQKGEDFLVLKLLLAWEEFMQFVASLLL